MVQKIRQVIVAFFALVETGFYLRFRRFYWFVQHHGKLAEIERAHSELMADAGRGARMLLALHLALAAAAVLLSPFFVDALTLTPREAVGFRFAVIGGVAHGFLIYALIFLSYFDLRKRALHLATTFLVLNATFGMMNVFVGFPVPGAGYFLAALFAAVAGIFAVRHELKRLRYTTFVANNPSIGRSL